MTGLSAFNTFTGDLKEQDQLMPVLFIGHGSHMNGIEDNAFSQRWAAMAKEIHSLAAVLVVSAHWLSRDTKITAMDFPRTIHDFGGFPKHFLMCSTMCPATRYWQQKQLRSYNLHK